MKTLTRRAALVSLLSLFLASPAALAQGLLTPPGAPAPTMKTLQQIEPRIDLQNAPTSAVTTTNTAYHFIINQPGSYYLSANVGVTKTNGIQINAEGVTLDLNGFEISRAGGSGGNGIEIPATSHRASVRNGSLKGFAFGVNSILASGYARACAFRDLAVSGCTDYGIWAGDGAVLEACRAHDNSGFAGIYARSGSTLVNCSAFNNTATYGIFANNGSTLTNCAAYNNTSSAATSAGIKTGSGCTITHCTASFNSSAATSSTPTTGVGFDVGASSTIHGCTAYMNEGDGIHVFADTVVRDNTCDSNGNNGDGAGIHATGGDNRIEGNNVTDNDRGIDVDVSGNFIARNTASGNTSNYELAANNVFGAIVNRTAPGSAAVSGSSAASSAGTTDPWANFVY